MRWCKYSFIGILLAYVMMSGCAGVAGKEQALGPEATVEAFCRAIAGGEIDQARMLCDTVSMKGYLDTWKAAWTELEQKDSSALRIASGILSESSFAVVKVEKDGGRRIVTYTLEAEGNSKTCKAVVKKEESGWRVESMTDAQ